MALDAEGRRLATIGYNPIEERKSSLRIFDVDSDQAPIEGESVANYRLTGIAWSPDQQRIVANMSHSPSVWDATTGKLLYEIPALIHCSAFTDDGEWFCTMSAATHEFRIYQASTGQPLHTIPIDSNDRIGISDPSLKFFAVSPDKSQVAVAQLNSGEAGSSYLLPIAIYDLANPDKPLRVLEDESAIGCSLAFSPDGKRIAVSVGRRVGRDEFLIIDAITGDILLRREAEYSKIRFAGDSILAFSAFRENRHGARFSRIDLSPLAPQQEGTLAIAAIKSRNKNRPVLFPSEANAWLEADPLLSKQARALASQGLLEDFNRQKAYRFLWTKLNQASSPADLSRTAELLEELCRHDENNLLPLRALTLVRVRQHDRSASQQTFDRLLKRIKDAKLKPAAEDVAVDYLVSALVNEGPVAASKLNELRLLPSRDEEQFAALLERLEKSLPPRELSMLQEEWKGRKIMPRIGRAFDTSSSNANLPYFVTRVEGDQLYCGPASIHRHHVVPLNNGAEYYTRHVQMFPESYKGYSLRAYTHQLLNKSEEAEKDFLEAIKLSSHMEREREQIALSQIYKARGDHVRQLQVLNQAVQDTESFQANEPGPLLNRRAWLLATCPMDEVRDGAQALQDARRACEWVRWNDPIYLDTFAAALADNKNFPEAIRWQTKAISLLTNGDDKGDYESRLKLYERGQPFRENSK